MIDNDEQSGLSSRPELEEKLSEQEILRQSIADGKAREKDLMDQLLRLNAEFQNFRKRSEQRLTESRRMGKEDVLLQAISLLDGLIQAEKSSEHAKDVGELKKGLALIKHQFEKFLADQGLVAIKAKGEKLDPHRHEAITQVVVDSMEEGTVVDEIQRGYTLEGQVVRPSRVSVAAAPKESAEKSKEEQNHG